MPNSLNQSQSLTAMTLTQPEALSPRSLSPGQWRFIAGLPLAGAGLVLAGSFGGWLGGSAVNNEPSAQPLSQLLADHHPQEHHAAQATPAPMHDQSPASGSAQTPGPVAQPPTPPAAAGAAPLAAVLPSATEAPTQRAARTSDPASATMWAPNRLQAERSPSDHPAVDDHQAPLRVRVVTIRARVTAYTPYDHAVTHPQWADGIVAWHPGGRKRSVEQHRYGLATDWSQFPPGATFIRVPGYMSSTYPTFPESFRVVDDACGQSRKARRQGLQPVIDVRFMTRYSAVDPRHGWGSRNLDVEVIYPESFVIPHSLRRWVIADEWHTYHRGTLISRQKR